jgi:opacity protein-like surface antigen
MTLRSSILAGAALLALGSTSTFAADLYGGKGGSIKDGGYPVETTPARQSNFYVRGDFSFAQHDLGDMTEPPNYKLTETSIGRNWSYGGGLGYYFSKNVRGDLTLDFRQNANVRGTVHDPLAKFEGERQFGLKSMVGLANLYYDFDMRSHFTPYLGVGLGFVNHKTKDGSVVGAPVGCGCGYEAVTIDGASNTAAAGALMAGFSAKLHDRVSLDAGYRFLYLGHAHTGDIKGKFGATAATAAVTTTPDPLVSDITAHEFRVGLRFDIK